MENLNPTQQKFTDNPGIHTGLQHQSI